MGLAAVEIVWNGGGGRVSAAIGPGPRRQLYALPTGDCQRRCAYLMVHLTTAAAATVAEGGDGKEASGRRHTKGWMQGCRLLCRSLFSIGCL